LPNHSIRQPLDEPAQGTLAGKILQAQEGQNSAVSRLA
jgi:hypothetical protein